MSEMERIIRGLKDREIDIKNGWDNLSPESWAKIISFIKEYSWKKSEQTVSQKRDKNKTQITLVQDTQSPEKKPWFLRKEEALERLICVFEPDNYFNQFQLSSECKAKELVDLVAPRSKPNTFIELKPWGCKTPPTYAVIELLKNYHLYAGKSKIENLIVLAPKEYYKRFQGKNNNGQNQLTVFLLFVAKLDTKIKVQYLDLKKDDFDTCVAKLNELPLGWETRNTTQYNERVEIELSMPEVKRCFECIKDQITTFHELTDEVIGEWQPCLT